jgi:hypothetical protein
MSFGALLCTGEVSISGDGAPLCSGVWSLMPLPEPFSLELLDPAILAQAFAAGFVIVGTCWFAGLCFKSLLSMIK